MTERGTCQICGRNVPIRVNGAARQHDVRVGAAVFSVRVNESGYYVCTGSGKPPAAEARQATP